MKIHSFEPVVDESSKILILGTMPGIKSLQENQYYGNKNNAFWKIMYNIFDGELSSDYNEKLGFLLRNKIALWDTLKYCERESSLDSDIRMEFPNDISRFLLKYNNIRSVIFNGQAALKFYKKYNELFQNISYFKMPSTSPANARINFVKKLELWKEIRQNLLEK